MKKFALAVIYAKVLWVPMNKNLPEGYEKPEENKYLENCSKNFSIGI